MDKGYEGADLAKLLILVHRLWPPKRMAQFVEIIPAAPTEAQAAAATDATAAATDATAAATDATAAATDATAAVPYPGLAALTAAAEARLPPSPTPDFELPVYAAAAARAQAARSDGEDKAEYGGRHYRTPNSAVAAYLDIEAEEVSDQRVQEDDDELPAEDEQ